MERKFPLDNEIAYCDFQMSYESLWDWQQQGTFYLWG